MNKTETLHVKLDVEEDRRLKKLAYEQGKSKGQLVREALSACYQVSLLNIPVRQRQALNAYEGGFISIGKLAKEMGMPVLDLRKWLLDHDILQASAFMKSDADNA